MGKYELDYAPAYYDSYYSYNKSTRANFAKQLKAAKEYLMDCGIEDGLSRENLI